MFVLLFKGGDGSFDDTAFVGFVIMPLSEFRMGWVGNNNSRWMGYDWHYCWLDEYGVSGNRSNDLKARLAGIKEVILHAR